MSADENKVLVRRWVEEGYGQGELDLVEELFAADLLNRTPLPGQPADRAGVEQAVMMLRGAFAGLRVTIEDIVAEGDRVVVRDQTRARHTGVFAGVPPTGAEVTVSRIAIYRVADGKIAEHWAVVDMLGLMRQLGVLPAPSH